MNSTPALGKAKAYIDVETNFLPMQPSHFPHGEDGPFITVSRAAGTGGSAFAKALATRIEAREGGGQRWTVFDSELVQQMLLEAKLPSRLARYLPEDRIPAIVSAVGEILGLHPDLWTLVERTNETVRRLAMLGHAVVVGRGGNFATAGLANGLNIRLIGSPERRASRLAESQSCTLDDALALVRRIDTARRDYVLSAFGRDVDDASAYDLVINTDALSMAEGVDAILAVLSRRRLVTARR
jgi:cytidylate kinase